MTAEHVFAGLAIASFSLLALLLWWERPRKPPTRTTVPASRWPPYSEP